MSDRTGMATAPLPSALACVLDGMGDEQLARSLAHSYKVRQIFRTPTEARVSVLNDGDHPTLASKYWQIVREQSAMLESAASEHIALKRARLRLKEIERKLDRLGGRVAVNDNDLERESLSIDHEEALMQIAGLQASFNDRMRELTMWDELKHQALAEAEATGQSFDADNPDAHQRETLRLVLEHRARMAAASGSITVGELGNVLGPLATLGNLTERAPA